MTTTKRRFTGLVIPVLCLAWAGCISITEHERQMRECRQAGVERQKAEDQAKIYRLRNDRLQEQVVQSARERRGLEKELKSREADITDVRLTYDALITSLKEELADGTVEVSTTASGHINISVADKILFDSGKADLKVHGHDVMGAVARSLAGKPGYFVRVEGHTDNVPIVGDLARRYPSNWELSAARAAAVVHTLQDQGVKGEDLILAAFSEYQPAADNDTDGGRQRNRRVEILVGPKE